MFEAGGKSYLLSLRERKREKRALVYENANIC